VRYTKPPLTFEQQADRLLNRGMSGDRSVIISRLRSVNYYRLSGYWFPFRIPNPETPSSPSETFKPGTTFDEVWARYAFDRRLRLLVMDAIERVEVAVRTGIAYHHAHLHGPFAYAMDNASLPKLTPDEYTQFSARVSVENGRSKETFVKHFGMCRWRSATIGYSRC
jgi:abortive infection bacteriophage resistance protein